jgi:predicted porin
VKKTLIALAVAAAVPALAQAQTSVTLSGNVKVGLNSYKLSNGAANGSGMAMGDGSSRFIIAGTEDLGGGLKANFQWDTRLRPDEGTGTLGSGVSFVGLSGGFGQVRLGRIDQHYVYGIDEHGARATALQHSSISVLSYVGGTSALTSAAVANASRTANLVRWDSNNMGGFTAGVGYSTAYAGAEGGVGDAGKGSAITANLGYAAGPLSVGVSLWDAKSEDKTAGQKSTRLWAGYTLGIASVGLTWDQSSISTGLTTTKIETKRDAFSIPVKAAIGPGTLMFTYTQAQDAKVAGASAANTGAKMFTLGYDYPFSKRTSLGVSYANLNNGTGAAYQLFTGNALSNMPTPTVGQDTSSFYVGLRHAF